MGDATTTTTTQLMAKLDAALTPLADPEAAFSMSAYMKDHFDFLGIKAGDRRQAQRPVLADLADVDGPQLLDFARACWAAPYREYQYTACDALRKHVGKLRSSDLDAIQELARAKSWWDTIDSLGPHTVGPMVTADPSLADQMDIWIDDDDFWVARVAILHQLMYKERTDDERLFHYTDKRAGDTEFFIRKALGWALRQYARTDPEAVRAYVAANADRLSGLTKREALKHLA